MKGSNPNGEAIAKSRPDNRDFKNLLPEQTVRDLRRSLHINLEIAGYSKAQIGQISGHSGRTIRRDLENPNAPSLPRDDQRDDPRRDGKTSGHRQTSSDRRWGTRPDAKPRRLTRREVAELRLEYGASDLPDIVVFLDSLTATDPD